MKKLIYILLVLSVSCTDLTERPASNLTTSQFYKNQDEAIAAVNAIYHRMFTESLVLFNRQLLMFEMSTDDHTAGPRTRSPQVIDMSKLTHVPNNLAVEWTWQYTYEAINRANIAIDRIELLDELVILPDIKQQLINEAKLLRAWNYFNLVRWYGPVPLVLHETTSLSNETLNVSKSSEDEIYDQIIQDLTDAEDLPIPGTYSSADVGRATAGTAKTLLVKVYLTRQQWQNAANKAKELIDSGWYDLFEDFADVFNANTKNGIEHIFSIQYNGDPSYAPHLLAQTTAPLENPFNGDYIDAPHTPGGLFTLFAANDERKEVTFVTELQNPVTGEIVKFSEPHFHKYWDPAVPTTPQRSSKNVPLLRYADVLLMYAEALNELNGPTAEAYSSIDRVRERANIELLKDSAPGLSKEQFRDSVFLERRKELALEYHRWFDLARRGPDEYVKALHAAGKLNAAPRHVHFPTPQRELQLNPNLEQHPDWVGF